MGLFDGLSKFGMKGNIREEIGDDLFLTSKEKELARLRALKNGDAGNDGMSEEERRLEMEKGHLFKKNIRCKCCDKIFPTLVPRSGHVKRMEPDMDLRPRCEHFDTLKYGVYHCPNCGYTSIARNFPRLSDRYRKVVEEKICSRFKPEPPIDNKDIFTYDEAIDYHKLALFTEVVKDGKASDKAYICLLIGWLYRGKREELEHDAKKNQKEIEQCKTEEKECLQQAFEGFTRALAKETAPFAGMNELTMEYLLATLAIETGRYDVAVRSISNIITSRSAPSRMKDKARLLKEEVLDKLRAEKQQQTTV